MFNDSARTFLQQPLIARLATNDPDGFPHVVPVWFVLDGDDIVMVSVEKTAKVRHLHADNRASVVIGGNPEQNEAGYLIKGRVTINPDHDLTWTRKITFLYEPPEQAEKDVKAWADLGMIVLRLQPENILKVM